MLSERQMRYCETGAFEHHLLREVYHDADVQPFGQKSTEDVAKHTICEKCRVVLFLSAIELVVCLLISEV